MEWKSFLSFGWVEKIVSCDRKEKIKKRSSVKGRWNEVVDMAISGQGQSVSEWMGE
jgi:hypothetical protein